MTIINYCRAHIRLTVCPRYLFRASHRNVAPKCEARRISRASRLETNAAKSFRVFRAFYSTKELHIAYKSVFKLSRAKPDMIIMCWLSWPNMINPIFVIASPWFSGPLIMIHAYRPSNGYRSCDLRRKARWKKRMNHNLGKLIEVNYNNYLAVYPRQIRLPRRAKIVVRATPRMRAIFIPL